MITIYGSFELGRAKFWNPLLRPPWVVIKVNIAFLESLRIGLSCDGSVSGQRRFLVFGPLSHTYIVDR